MKCQERTEIDLSLRVGEHFKLPEFVTLKTVIPAKAGIQVPYEQRCLGLPSTRE